MRQKLVRQLTHVGAQQRDPMNPRIKLKNGIASASRKDRTVIPIVDDLISNMSVQEK